MCSCSTKQYKKLQQYIFDPEAHAFVCPLSRFSGNPAPLCTFDALPPARVPSMLLHNCAVSSARSLKHLSTSHLSSPHLSDSAAGFCRRFFRTLPCFSMAMR